MVFPVTFITPQGMNYIVRKVNEWGLTDYLLGKDVGALATV